MILTILGSLIIVTFVIMMLLEFLKKRKSLNKCREDVSIFKLRSRSVNDYGELDSMFDKLCDMAYLYPYNYALNANIISVAAFIAGRLLEKDINQNKEQIHD